MSDSYLQPAAAVQIEYQMKKSRFIGRALPALDRAEAMAHLAQAKLDYPDARHHCWAYFIGNPRSPALVAFADDGEPSGTAGKPILNVLQHKLVGDVMLIVSRYFGGVKLGAGGLVRAYSSAAQLAMEQLSTQTYQPMTAVIVAGEFSLEQPLRHWLDLHQGLVEDVCYSEGITMTVAVTQSLLATLQQFVLAQGGQLTAPENSA